MVAALLGFSLWRSGLAATVGAPGAKAEAAQLAEPITVSRPQQRDQPPAAHLSSVALAEQTMAFEALKLRAKQGDAAAQRELALTYEKCVEASYRQDEFVPLYEWKSKQVGDPSQAAVRVRVAKERAQACKSVDGGALIPAELIKGWLEQAAKNGDLAAQVRVAAYSGKAFDEKAVNQFIERLVKSNDPAAVFMMGDLMGVPSLQAGGQKYNHVVTSAIDIDAWMVAGCRMGYDCSASSDIMDTLCLDTGICGGQDLEEYIRSFKSDEDAQAFDRKIEEIRRLLQQQ